MAEVADALDEFLLRRVTGVVVGGTSEETCCSSCSSSGSVGGTSSDSRDELDALPT